MSSASIHRWPAGSLTADLVRGAAATAIAGLLLLAMPVASIAFWGVLGLTILFALYLMSSVSRLTSVIEVDDEGLRMSGGVLGARTVKWAELTRFELRHFPLSRDRTRGWMDLKLSSGGAAVAIDDRLERFDELLARAWKAARAAEIGISDATHHNLIAAGLLPNAKS